jgi:hypothetical protein
VQQLEAALESGAVPLPSQLRRDESEDHVGELFVELARLAGGKSSTSQGHTEALVERL